MLTVDAFLQFKLMMELEINGSNVGLLLKIKRIIKKSSNLITKTFIIIKTYTRIPQTNMCLNFLFFFRNKDGTEPQNNFGLNVWKHESSC